MHRFGDIAVLMLTRFFYPPDIVFCCFIITAVISAFWLSIGIT
jgi:hypothetical protein